MPEEINPPLTEYWHLWRDEEEGFSHQVRCKLDKFIQDSVGNAEPQWNDA